MDEVFYKIDKPANLHGLKGAALFREKRKDNEILSAMDEDTYEEFIASWAYYCVKNKAEGYQDVLRIGGPGDGGMDVAVFYHQEIEIVIYTNVSITTLPLVNLRFYQS